MRLLRYARNDTGRRMTEGEEVVNFDLVKSLIRTEYAAFKQSA